MARADRFQIHGQGERRKQLEDRVFLIAGVDPDRPDTPYFLPITPAGLKVDSLGGGAALPRWDSAAAEYYPGTNNLKKVTYKVGADTVAVFDITYVGGGVANNDLPNSIELTRFD